ncbi:MAG: Holliday junction resolvase RuvX [Chitinophagales bacterium]|nr:Holliday junction resolvase RuvX [Chitinophagales bacterium]
MSRIIALDYGLKRTGVAVTDPLKIIATSLETIESSSLLKFLESYFLNEKVELLIIGDPKHLNNSPMEFSKNVNSVIREINIKFPSLKIIRVDERFSSKMAQQAILESGVNKKRRRDKALIDKISAVIILQNYLESIH